MSDDRASAPAAPDPAGIAAVLRRHPAVRECVVLPQGAGRLVAYVAPHPDYPERLDATAAPGQEHAQVAQWQARYEAIYRAGAGAADPTFNTAGWIDILTGAPMPAAAMRAWVAGTVARIRAWRPRRVLEIGCGTGLLLFRLAPHCEQYWGTDFSPPALDALGQVLARARPHLPGVTLLPRAADDWTGIPAATFDTVILNSVVQYFPSLAYFLRVLDGALRVLAPGGRIFVGDVRSLPLLPAFHAQVALREAPADCPRAVLQARIAARVAGEQELLLAPALFAALPAEFPAIQAAAVHLKGGNSTDEMTLFRYDAVLETGQAPAPAPAPQSWAAERLTVPAVRRLLTVTRPAALAVAGVPDARLAPVLAAHELLGAAAGPPTAGAIRAALATAPPAAGIAPDALRALAAGLPYTATASPAASGRLGYFDVLYRRWPAAGVGPAAVPDAPPAAGSQSDVPAAWLAYANTPRLGTEARALVLELRRFLAAHRGWAGGPAAFVIMDALPRTAAGDLDLAALPAGGSA